MSFTARVRARTGQEVVPLACPCVCYMFWSLSCGRSLTFQSEEKWSPCTTIVSVGRFFFLVDIDGEDAGERLCRTAPEPLGLFQPGPLDARSRLVCLGSKCLTVCPVAVSQPTCKDDAHSPGPCAREHATHSPDTGHIEVQARTTRTFTHADRHTHMPHAFTHTEASRLYSPVPGDTFFF